MFFFRLCKPTYPIWVSGEEPQLLELAPLFGTIRFFLLRSHQDIHCHNMYMYKYMHAYNYMCVYTYVYILYTYIYN